VRGSIRDQVDLFFSLGCTHWQLAKVAEHGPHIEMHSRRMKAYIRMMKDLIRIHGEFTEEKEEPSLRNLHLRESWRGDDLPDPNMFNSMPPCLDGVVPGENLPADYIYLMAEDLCGIYSPRRLAS